MKTISNILSLMIGVLVMPTEGLATGNGNNRNKAEVCLEIQGLALDENNKPINGVEVRLLLENEELEWIEVTSIPYHEHGFKFSLLPNKQYTIEVSKQGYVTRSIHISTKIPAYVDLVQAFRYEFDLQLFKEKKGVDDYYLDFPIALISYDSLKAVFDYSRNYTTHIKTKIKETTGYGNRNALRITMNK